MNKNKFEIDRVNYNTIHEIVDFTIIYYLYKILDAS